MDTYSMIKMQSSKAKDNSFNLQKLGILASFCSLYIAYKADWGDLFTYFSVENFVAMASFVDEQNDAIGEKSHFHELKLECGFDHFVPLKTFNDASNGYLVEDKCVFGTEVFVTKERGRVKAECLSLIKDTCSVKKIQIYPKGLDGSGSYLTFYLDLVHYTPDSKVYTDCTLRIVDQLHSKHIAFKADHCFTPTNYFCGWQKFVTPSYLNNPSNGCLVKDVCLVEAEVNVWGCQSSTADIVKKIQLYPKGRRHGNGSHLSLYLVMADSTTLSPASKIYAEFTLRILDQVQARHIAGKGNYWYNASNPETGWARFATMSYFNQHGNGLLVKDVCSVEAEVTIHGIASAL
ncbi:hypothetical protein EZV62_000049 [Acer yangbiense]|uniref:MATH domain-containing protein n=1 Tax=Acer yangbiense TaxID=1000413 RepID=A0A5C7IQ96_9ROSI|nr:hypothetical protein EZV62_000049 [Acer yangbiense]